MPKLCFISDYITYFLLLIWCLVVSIQFCCISCQSGAKNVGDPAINRDEINSNFDNSLSPPAANNVQNAEAQTEDYLNEEDIEIVDDLSYGSNNFEDDQYFSTPAPQKVTPTYGDSNGNPYCTDRFKETETENTFSPKSSEKFLIFLSTLDGNLVALNGGDGGRLVWTLATDSQPLLASTLAHNEVCLLQTFILLYLEVTLGGGLCFKQFLAGS